MSTSDEVCTTLIRCRDLITTVVSATSIQRALQGVPCRFQLQGPHQDPCLHLTPPHRLLQQQPNGQEPRRHHQVLHGPPGTPLHPGGAGGGAKGAGPGDRGTGGRSELGSAGRGV